MKKHLILFVILIFLSSCGDNAETVDVDQSAKETDTEELDEDISISPVAIIPGTGVGDVRIGMKYSEVTDLIGKPDSEMGFNRLVTADYKTLSFELVFTSPDLAVLKDDAVLIAIGAKNGGNFSGKVVPGMTRDEISKVVVEENEDTGDYVFYPSGFSVQYENDISVLIGVFPPYKISYVPPEMTNCKTSIE